MDGLLQKKCAIALCRNQPEPGELLCKQCMKRNKNRRAFFQAFARALQEWHADEQQRAESEEPLRLKIGGDADER